MSKIEKLLLNMSSNWVGYAVNSVVLLLLTPFVLAKLGLEGYGVWVLIQSLIGSYGLLDFGLRAGVNQFLIRSVAARDTERGSAVLSTSVAALTALGAFTLIVTIALALTLPHFFELPGNSIQESRNCVLIIGTAASVQIAMSPFSSVFIAIQRFDILSSIVIVRRLGTAGLIVWFLNIGYGLMGVAAATALGTVAEQFAKFFVARRKVPELKISWSNLQWSELYAIGTFGLWNLLISVSAYGYLHLFPLVLAAMLPIGAVGHFGLAAAIWHGLNGLFTPIGQVIYPVAAELHVKQDTGALYRVYRDGTRMLLLMVVSVAIIAFVWADDFFALWVGDEYLSDDPFTSVSTIFRAMLVTTVLGYSANFAGQILIGAGHIKALSLLKVSGTALSLVLLLSLIGPLGLIAVPVSMAVSSLAFDLFGITKVLDRLEKIRVKVVSRLGGWRVALVAVLLVAVLGAFRESWVPSGWVELIVQGQVAAVIAGLAVVFIGLTDTERRQFVIAPIRRLMS